MDKDPIRILLVFCCALVSLVVPLLRPSGSASAAPTESSAPKLSLPRAAPERPHPLIPRSSESDFDRKVSAATHELIHQVELHHIDAPTEFAAQMADAGVDFALEQAGFMAKRRMEGEDDNAAPPRSRSQHWTEEHDDDPGNWRELRDKWSHYDPFADHHHQSSAKEDQTGAHSHAHKDKQQDGSLSSAGDKLAQDVVDDPIGSSFDFDAAVNKAVEGFDGGSKRKRTARA